MGGLRLELVDDGLDLVLDGGGLLQALRQLQDRPCPHGGVLRVVLDVKIDDVHRPVPQEPPLHEIYHDE